MVVCLVLVGLLALVAVVAQIAGVVDNSRTTPEPIHTIAHSEVSGMERMAVVDLVLHQELAVEVLWEEVEADGVMELPVVPQSDLEKQLQVEVSNLMKIWMLLLVVDPASSTIEREQFQIQRAVIL
jgi:hypothetical protein